MKNKEKLKQRVISPKLPPSQPTEHLCVLSSAKNDAIGCQLLPFGFCRVSCLLHPSFILEGKRKKEKRQKLGITLAQISSLTFLMQKPKVSPSITHTKRASCGVCTYITSTVISVVSHISAAPLSSADEDVVNYSCLNGGPWPPVCSFMHTFILWITGINSLARSMAHQFELDTGPGDNMGTGTSSTCPYYFVRKSKAIM